MAGIIAHLPGVGKPRFVPVKLADFVSDDEVFTTALGVLVAACGDVFGLTEEDDSGSEEVVSAEDSCRLLYGGRDLTNESAATAFLRTLRKGVPCAVRVVYRLLGGKGGFGALLRGQRGLGKKTTNFDAMRDLSGRRLRHSKAVDRIKEWMEKNKREDELVSLIKGEGPDLPKPLAPAEKLDPNYLQKLKRGAAERAKAVGAGIRVADTEGAATADGPSKRARLSINAPSAVAGWLDPLGGLSPPSSPDGEEAEEEQEAPEDKCESGSASSSTVAPTPASSSAASSAATASASAAAAALDEEETPEEEAVEAEEESSATAAAAAPAATAAPGPSAAKDDQEGARKRRGSKPPAPEAMEGEVMQPQELAAYASAEALADKVAPDTLKRSLMKLGLKCGGTPKERAARLFMLKEKSLKDLPKSVFAK